MPVSRALFFQLLCYLCRHPSAYRFGLSHQSIIASRRKLIDTSPTRGNSGLSYFLRSLTSCKYTWLFVMIEFCCHESSGLQAHHVTIVHGMFDTRYNLSLGDLAHPFSACGSQCQYLKRRFRESSLPSPRIRNVAPNFCPANHHNWYTGL
jgi:hypothetical protein